MKNSITQIFPFYLEEGQSYDDIPQTDSQSLISRSIQLEKIIFNPIDWFFTDDTEVNEIIYWKNVFVQNDILLKGIELNKSGISVSSLLNKKKTTSSVSRKDKKR